MFPADTTCLQFESMAYGYRAMFVLITTMSEPGLKTSADHLKICSANGESYPSYIGTLPMLSSGGRIPD